MSFSSDFHLFSPIPDLSFTSFGLATRFDLLRSAFPLQRLGHRLLATDLVAGCEQRHRDGRGVGDHLQQGGPGRAGALRATLARYELLSCAQWC